MREVAVQPAHRKQHHSADWSCSLLAASKIWEDLGPSVGPLTVMSCICTLCSRSFDQASSEHVQTIDWSHSMNL